MRSLVLLLALVLVPGALQAQQLDSLLIAKGDTVSELLGRPVAIVFQTPDLAGSATKNQVRLQAKLGMNDWVEWQANPGTALTNIFEEFTIFTIMGFGPDSMRFVADTIQTDSVYIYYKLR